MEPYVDEEVVPAPEVAESPAPEQASETLSEETPDEPAAAADGGVQG